MESFHVGPWNSAVGSEGGVLESYFGAASTLSMPSIIDRLLDRGALATPLPLGDLVAIVQHVLTARGPGTLKVTKVEGHATEIDVEQGRVKVEDKFGIDEADDVAELGRRSQTERLNDARRALFCVLKY